MTSDSYSIKMGVVVAGEDLDIGDVVGVDDKTGLIVKTDLDEGPLWRVAQKIRKNEKACWILGRAELYRLRDDE